jgi:hypothetical protein
VPHWAPPLTCSWWIEPGAASSVPPLTDRDTKLREDDIWKHAAKAYIAAKQQAGVTAAALDTAKAALVKLASHPSEAGGGVQVTRYWKAGAVDYKKVPQLKGIDLEQYRGPVREEIRVTVA